MHNMSNYFEKIKRVKKEQKITELDIWNMNLTGFQIVCRKSQLVVIMNSNKYD